MASVSPAAGGKARSAGGPELLRGSRRAIEVTHATHDSSSARSAAHRSLAAARCGDRAAAAPARGAARRPRRRPTSARRIRSARRSPPTPPVGRRCARSRAVAYEAIVRRYPVSGYCDNALWQAARLSSGVRERPAGPADRRRALQGARVAAEGVSGTARCVKQAARRDRRLRRPRRASRQLATAVQSAGDASAAGAVDEPRPASADQRQRRPTPVATDHGHHADGVAAWRAHHDRTRRRGRVTGERVDESGSRVLRFHQRGDSRFSRDATFARSTSPLVKASASGAAAAA